MPDLFRNDPQPRPILDLVTSVLFIAAICAPLVASSLGTRTEQTPIEEFRKPAKRPPLRFERQALTRFPERFEEYYADDFGLRNHLIFAHNALKWFVFGVSPTDSIVLGKKGWIFYRDDHSVENFRGAIPFTEQDLVAWTRMLESRRDWCAERGIVFILAVAPNKERVYPELMPNGIEAGEMRVDQLVEHVRQHSDVEVIDLSVPVKEERLKDGPGDDTVFRRLGTHWTDRGAFAACRELARHLREHFPAIELPSSERYELRERPIDLSDSWVGRLYFEGLLVDTEFRLVPVGWTPTARVVEERGAWRDVHWRSDNDSSPRGVVLHDSTGPQISPFLAECFSDVWFNATYALDTELIEKTKPDVVILLATERALVFLAPDVWPSEGDAEARKRFEASDRTLLRLDVSRNKPPLIAYRACRVRLDEGESVVVESSGPGGSVLLPTFEFPEAENVVLRLELDSPVESELLIGYQTRLDPEFDQRRSISRHVLRGANVLHVELLPSHLQGPLLLRPGTDPGDYEVRDLEIRAVPYE